MRAYQVAHGGMFEGRVDGSLGAYLPDNLTKLVNYTTADILEGDNNVPLAKRKDANTEVYGAYLHQQYSDKKVSDYVSNFQLSGTYTYPPLGYFHLAIFERLGEMAGFSIINIIYLTRFANLLLYTGCLYLIIRCLKYQKWLIVSIALLPVAIFQASSVTIDSIVNVASLALIALFINYRHQPDHKSRTIPVKLLVLGLLSILALTKPPYIALSLLFLMVDRGRLGGARVGRIWQSIWIIIPAILCLVWAKINSNVVEQLVVGLTSGNMKEQIFFLEHHPLSFVSVIARTSLENADLYISTMTGAIGDRTTGLPVAIMTVFTLIIIMLSMLITYPKKTRLNFKTRESFLILFIGTIIYVGVSLSLYLLFTPVKNPYILGVQGRYFIPLLPLAALACIRFNPFKLSIRESAAIKIISVLSLIFLSLTAIIYYMASY